MSLSLRDDLKYHVHSTGGAPTGWKNASLPQTSERLGTSTLPGSPTAEKIWEMLSGVAVAHSKFTVVIPVHNEARNLDEFFGSLMYLKVPPSVPAQIVFVANACSDHSAEFIKDCFTRIGGVGLFEHEFSSDSKATSLVDSAKNGEINFYLVQTPTAGKWNALNLGNELALRAGHRVALCVDSDAWLEPDAIARVAGDALLNFGDSPDAPVLVSGTLKGELKGNVGFIMQRVMSNRITQEREDIDSGPSGPLMAWDTEWLKRIGGVPPCKIEDYILGFISRQQNLPILKSTGSIWQYSVSTILDDFRQTRRFVHGAWQVIDRFRQDPDAVQMVRQELHYMMPFSEHLLLRLERIVKNPLRLPGQLGKFVFLELAKYFGRQDFIRDPHCGTWDRLESTKASSAALMPSAVNSSVFSR